MLQGFVMCKTKIKFVNEDVVPIGAFHLARLTSVLCFKLWTTHSKVELELVGSFRRSQ